MANYTPQTCFDLLRDWIAARTDSSNLGSATGDVFLTMCGIFQKHFYQVARKIDPTLFQTEDSVAVNGAQEKALADFETFNAKGCGVFASDAANGITDTPLRRTNRGSQSNGWWWDSKNAKVMFTGSLSDTYWIVYLPTFEKPSASDSDLLAQENNDEFVVDYFKRLYALWDFNGANGGRISLADQLLRDSMNRIVENLEVYSGIEGLPTNTAQL